MCIIPDTEGVRIIGIVREELLMSRQGTVILNCYQGMMLVGVGQL